MLAGQGKFVLSVNSLTLNKGDLTAVLGNNGSGKSTFLSILAGLRSYTGEYTINSVDFTKHKRASISKLIGLLPQEASINMPFDVFYVVLTGRFTHSDGMSYSKQDIGHTEMMMKRYDITHLRDRPFNELSGGEKRRVLIARALNMDTDAVLLDEPFSGVDIFHQIEIMKSLKVLKPKKVILVVIHDISFALQHFDRLLFFKEGEMLYDLTGQTLTSDKLSHIFDVNLKFYSHEDKKFLYVD